jgi:hypothetical protein
MTPGPPLPLTQTLGRRRVGEDDTVMCWEAGTAATAPPNEGVVIHV